jgi:uncharacterized protein
MPRSLIHKWLPPTEKVLASRFVQMFGPLLQHPNLWSVNRRSVAGGVAIGMFAGLIPGPFQMLGAAVLSVALRVNLPVAMATTLYTNPLTIVPLYLLAYAIGHALSTGPSVLVPPPEFSFEHVVASTQALLDWMLRLGRPLAIGLLLLALGLAVIGYFGVHLAWQIHVRRAWHRRKLRRAASGTERAAR